jgi:hypothetical protein
MMLKEWDIQSNFQIAHIKHFVNSVMMSLIWEGWTNCDWRRLPYRGGSDLQLRAHGRIGAPLTAARVRFA